MTGGPFVANALAACLLAFAGSACALVEPNDHYVFAEDGYDAAGDADTIHLGLCGVVGREPGAYGLVLPEDWSARAVVRGDDGVLRLEQPGSVELVPGAELDPPVTLTTRQSWAQERGVSHMRQPYLAVRGLVPLRLIRQRDQFDAAAAEEVATARLDAGASAYALVRSQPDSRITELQLLGARRVAGGLEWIELARMRFEDERGPGSEILAEVGAIAEIAWLVALPLVATVAIVVAVS